MRSCVRTQPDRYLGPLAVKLQTEAAVSGPDRPVCRDGLLIHEAVRGVVFAPTAPDLTTGVHLVIALVTSDGGATLIHLLMGPILAPHLPTATARADEHEAVVGRSAKQGFEIEQHLRQRAGVSEFRTQCARSLCCGYAADALRDTCDMDT